MKKIVFILICSYLLFVVLLPKQRLYFFLEEKLNKEYQVILNNEKVEDKLLFLNLSHLDILANGVEVGSLDNIKVFPFLFFNYVVMNEAKVLNALKNIFKVKINRVTISHNVFSFFTLSVKVFLLNETLEGKVDMKTRKVKLTFKNRINGLNMLKQYISKTSNGYKLELSF